MADNLTEHLKNLKLALLSLSATGEKGFEGLLGVALGKISGVPFRLAGSGLQFGIDGKPVYRGDAISFEAKRYENEVPRKEVLSKIAELSLPESSETDVWVLGATSQIRSQVVDAARAAGAVLGIHVMIFDWSETGLPPLGVVLAMGGGEVKEFLEKFTGDGKIFREAATAIEVISESQDFLAHAERIRAECNEPSLSWSLAKKSNSEWLNLTFSSKRLAKMEFGQPLSPADPELKKIVQLRRPLIEKLNPYYETAPDDSVLFITGGEGSGKSWIIAQSWLARQDKPLTIFMGPDCFTQLPGKIEIRRLIISTLLRQTGTLKCDLANENRRLNRWNKMFDRSKGLPVTNGPRIIIVIDGINQRPEYDWARIIERLSAELFQLGGRLIVTVRTPYFRDRIKKRLSIAYTELLVPEWTDPERDAILSAQGIKSSELHPPVAASLRNPRLLGIALDLLTKAEITNFEELSVSRLLFEHIRMSEKDAPIPQPAHEFARQLQSHAQEIIRRFKANQRDDLKIFEAEVGAVADGRFFRTIHGDPTRYTLKGEGLILALGFSVVDRLRFAQRNGRDLDAELNAILEPIAALDDTADVIIAALTVIETEEVNFGKVLVKGFSALQNPDDSKILVFSALARARADGFMSAAEDLMLAGTFHPNFDWIKGALILASTEARAWERIKNYLPLWLSFYSLSPERGTFARPLRDPEGKVQAERERNQKKIEERLQALSHIERSLLKDLPQRDGDLGKLSRFALFLLAGKPLAPFAQGFLNWSFSYALNSDFDAPYKYFRDLISLNRIDWAQTRAALLKASSGLRGADVSRTGKWALVSVLNSTGDSRDNEEAELLIEELRKDQPPLKGFSLLETYCATDPCDPSSEPAENVTNTAELYLKIDVKKIANIRFQTSEDLFWGMARPALARFKPDIAIQKHKEFAADILSRSGVGLRLGLFELRKHNALLTTDDVLGFLKEHEYTADSEDASGDDESWIVSQYKLLLSFPHISAYEQADALLSKTSGDKILIDLLDLSKPLNEMDFQERLIIAYKNNDERSLHLLLEFAYFSSTPLTKETRKIIAELFLSRSENIRTAALAVIARSGNNELLDRVVESGWRAPDPDGESGFEFWYGSIALLKAASRGLIAHKDVPDRISPRLYGRAAKTLDRDTVRLIAKRIDHSINHALGVREYVAPDIELQDDYSDTYEPSRFSIGDKEHRDLKEALERMSESDESFRRRQKLNHDAFQGFQAFLMHSEAGIILDNIKLDEFATIVGADEDLAKSWYGLFKNLPDIALTAAHNIILMLAYALGSKHPTKFRELFKKVESSKPIVRLTFTRIGLPLDVTVLWAGPRNSILDKLRFDRLDLAETDHDLFIEVLAALLNRQGELLQEYVKVKILKNEPSEIARALLVAGFSDQGDFNFETLKTYESYSGLIGDAQKAATYAYLRNSWARHWFEQMCHADMNTDFWRYSVLFSNVVDGRFELWKSDYKERGRPIQLFGPSIFSGIENRYNQWKNHRSKKLFGVDAPDKIFLSEHVGNGR